MNLRQQTNDVQTRKALKVDIPTGLVLDLHRAKLLTGKSISSMVDEALQSYFEALRHQRSNAKDASETRPPGALESGPPAGRTSAPPNGGAPGPSDKAA